MNQLLDHHSLFPFIVGCGRSGTTLLTVMLDSHPELAIPGESGKLIIQTCRQFPPTDQSAHRRRFTNEQATAIVDGLFASHRFRAWQLDRDQLILHLIRHQVSTGSDVVRTILALYALKEGKVRFGDKTPSHVLHMPYLATTFPESVFIHVIRDGRDVALALLDASFGPTTVESAATYWTHRVQTGRRAGRSLGPRRYLEVHYEHLITDPEVVLRNVTRFLRLDYDPLMLQYIDASQRQLNMSPAPAEDESLTRPLTHGLRDWRVQMKPVDIATFDLLAAKLIDQLGYQVGQNHLPPRVIGEGVIRAARETLRWRWDRLTCRTPTW